MPGIPGFRDPGINSLLVTFSSVLSLRYVTHSELANFRYKFDTLCCTVVLFLLKIEFA